MGSSVFYSWQSDLPNATNRSFIEAALEKSIKEISKTTLEEAERDDPPVLDKDTKGVPGIPPIVDVIFQKISNAAVFVPDLSFVATGVNGRKIPNPNVLIEYGWALASLGHSRIIPVINEAFGVVTPESLPFDMRHLRHPLTYNLPGGATPQDRAEAKRKLTKDLTSALKLILAADQAKSTDTTPNHLEIESTTDPSTFLQPGEPLGVVGRFVGQSETTITVKENEHLFLRLMPIKPTMPIKSSTVANDLIGKGGVRPLSEATSGWSQGRNRYGAFVCTNNDDNAIELSQLFLNNELWGINTYGIDKQHCMQWADVEFGFFPCSLFESIFLNTLSSYLRFYQETLKIETPLKFIAGATNVEGYRMTAPQNMHFGGFERFSGRVVNDHIIYTGEIHSYEAVVSEILRPFFNHVWEECGLSRPDQARL